MPLTNTQMNKMCFPVPNFKVPYYILHRLIRLHICSLYTPFLLFLHDPPTQSSALNMQAECSVSTNKDRVAIILKHNSGSQLHAVLKKGPGKSAQYIDWLGNPRERSPTTLSLSHPFLANFVYGCFLGIQLISDLLLCSL